MRSMLRSMARCLACLVLALAACDPAVQSTLVVATDARGNVLTQYPVGVVPVGEVRTIALRIANQTDFGAEPLQLSIIGAAAADFDIVDGCQGVALAPNSSCALELAFQSSTVGKRRAELAVDAAGTTILEFATDVFMPAVQ